MGGVGRPSPCSSHAVHKKGSAAQQRRLETVVQNWFPRFVANDIDALDLRRMLDRIDSWDRWAPVWVEAGERYETLGDSALSQGHLVTAGSHLRRAALTYQFAQFVLHEDANERERIQRRQADVYRRAAPLLRPPAIATEVVCDGVTCRGYVRYPAGDEPVPLIVLLPGLESTKEQFSTFEPFFLDRGVATLSFEGPGQGEASHASPFRDDAYARAFGAVLDHARALERIAADGVGVLGTSFGGYLALRCASANRDLAAVVDIAGPYDLSGFETWQPVTQESFMHFVGAEDPSEVTRIAQTVSLEGRLTEPFPPVLVVHGSEDGIIPVDNATRIGSDLPSAEVWIVEGGNHSCNNFHTTVRPAIADWVADRLGTVR